MRKSVIAIVGAVIVLGVLLGSCYRFLWGERGGKLVIMGSTTVLPIVEHCARVYMEENPRVEVRVSGGGSGVGFANLIDGVCDIAMASRPPKEEELKRAEERGVELTLHEIALDAVAVVVHPSVVEPLGGEPLKLTLEMVGRIFSGELRYWDEVDGRLPHMEIVVFTREPGSGTRETFEEACLKPFGLEVRADASVQHGNPAMRDAVAKTPYSIGYIGMGFITSNVVPLPLAEAEGKPHYEPTEENVRAGVYPIMRYLYLVTDGEPEPGSLIEEFIDFILSPEGQEIVEEEGFISLG